MKILLTGASGFVGSHILDALRARGLTVRVLLRSSSSKAFIASHLGEIQICNGSINEPASLPAALKEITHVVHCAGATRAARDQDYYDVNQTGTRNLLDAARQQPGSLRRFLHISSLAVSGPAPSHAPATEDSPTQPISDYGRSKLLAEQEVHDRCPVPHVILRPPAVYGPRDNGFLALFRAVENHFLPKPSATQSLSLVYVKDLAQAVARCVDHPAADGRTFFVASPEVVTARMMAEEIARQSGRWTISCPLPPVAFYPVCAINQVISKLTGRTRLLNLQKYAELRAPGWVCDPARLHREIGYSCGTPLKKGIAETLNWYRQEKWV